MKSLPSVSVISIVLSVSFAGFSECISQCRGWGFGASVRSNTMKMSGRQNTTCRVKFVTWPLGYAFAAGPAEVIYKRHARQVRLGMPFGGVSRTMSGKV